MFNLHQVSVPDDAFEPSPMPHMKIDESPLPRYESALIEAKNSGESYPVSNVSTSITKEMHEGTIEFKLNAIDVSQRYSLRIQRIQGDL